MSEPSSPIKRPSGEQPKDQTNDGWENDRAEQVIEKIDETEESIINSVNQREQRMEEINRLREENINLQQRISKLKSTPPLPAYIFLTFGLLVLTLGLYSKDLVYAFGGLSIVAVSSTSIFESKKMSERVK